MQTWWLHFLCCFSQSTFKEQIGTSASGQDRAIGTGIPPGLKKWKSTRDNGHHTTKPCGSWDTNDCPETIFRPEHMEGNARRIQRNPRVGEKELRLRGGTNVQGGALRKPKPDRKLWNLLRTLLKHLLRPSENSCAGSTQGKVPRERTTGSTLQTPHRADNHALPKWYT